MANNFPGISRRTQPRVVVRNRTLQRGATAAGGDRILCIIGEGETEEVLITAARGSGADGLNPDYSGTTAPDGRHFKTSQIGLISNRTKLFKNGVQLDILEEAIDTDPFDARYDARVDPTTGRIELQRSYLVSVGTDLFYTANSANVGNGSPVLDADSLVDDSAPQETWTARCVSVVKDGYGNTIAGEAVFSVSGSVSGVIKDSSGTPIRWKSDAVVVSNGILSMAFREVATSFAVGDRFTIRVASGVLAKNDELMARYIYTLSLNTPELLSDASEVFRRFGEPSTTNTLSLGAQIAFENAAPQVLCMQAKPSLPRRTSATILAPDDPLSTDVEGASGSASPTSADTIFALPNGARPDADTEINIFVVDPDGTEEQLVLTKTEFYNDDWNSVNSVYSSFVSGAYSQAYTVVETPEVEQSGIDGYVLTTSTTNIIFSSATAVFSDDRLVAGEGDVGKQIVVIAPSTIDGIYTITSIGDGYGDYTTARATRVSGTNTSGVETENVSWQVVDPSGDVSVQLAITDDIAVQNLTVGKGIRISYVDQRDADFFDANWGAALQELEASDLQILVPLPTQTISNIFQAARSHVDTMSNLENARERTLIIGALNGLTPNNLIGRSLAAVEDIGLLEGVQGDDVEEVLNSNIEDLANYSVPDAFGGTFRVTYMTPDEIIRNINGTATALPGYYLAAALGGFLAGQGNIAEPPTNKILNGFSILRDRVYRSIQLDELADAGVLVVEPVAGGGRMLHGITTVQSNAAEEEEISVVQIRDHVSRALRNSLQPYIGTVQGPNTVASMTATVSNTLSAMVPDLLTSVGQIAVARDPVEPRQYNVVAQVAPVVATTWIFCDVSVAI